MQVKVESRKYERRQRRSLGRGSKGVSTEKEQLTQSWVRNGGVTPEGTSELDFIGGDCSINVFGPNKRSIEDSVRP